MNKIVCLFLILFLLFSKLAFAFSDISGEYMIKLKGVDGGIEIKAKEKDKFEFELNTVTGGWYTCNVEGVATFIEKNRAIFRDEEGCLITFTFKNNQIDLKTQNCSIYCGLNGIMDGKYVKKIKKRRKRMNLKIETGLNSQVQKIMCLNCSMIKILLLHLLVEVSLLQQSWLKKEMRLLSQTYQ